MVSESFFFLTRKLHIIFFGLVESNMQLLPQTKGYEEEVSFHMIYGTNEEGRLRWTKLVVEDHFRPSTDFDIDDLGMEVLIL